VRIIFRTIIDAFRSMAFILLLLLLIAYLFSIFAINLFADYSRASDPSLKYNDRFSNLLHAFISLFQIMTLDHWNSIAAEARSYVNPVISTIFFVVRPALAPPRLASPRLTRAHAHAGLGLDWSLHLPQRVHRSDGPQLPGSQRRTLPARRGA
jgi:hypothetical protein